LFPVKQKGLQSPDLAQEGRAENSLGMQESLNHPNSNKYIFKDTKYNQGNTLELRKPLYS